MKNLTIKHQLPLHKTTGTPTEFKPTEIGHITNHHFNLIDTNSPNPNPIIEIATIADRIVYLGWSESHEATILALSNGDIYHIRDGWELMGTFNHGYDCFEMDPQGERLVIVNEGKVVCLGFDLAFICEHDLFGEGEMRGVDEWVSIGWGKEETQFKGPKLHALNRDQPKQTTPADQEMKEDGEVDQSVNVEWKNNGDYFVVSYFDPKLKSRKGLVFDNQGVLKTTKKLNSTSALMAWKPNGHLIATTNHAEVIFFEKNLLRHGGFSLSKELKTLDLKWNCDGTILAIKAENTQPNNTSWLLYTSNNYHWYPKHELTAYSPTPTLTWDPHRPLVLRITDAPIGVDEIGLGWVLCRQYYNAECDFALMAVVDGASLLLTPFRTAPTPPPMCWGEVDFAANVVLVAFEKSRHGLVRLAVVTSDDTLYVVQLDYCGDELHRPKITHSLPFAGYVNNVNVRSLLFVDDGVVVFGGCGQTTAVLKFLVMDSLRFIQEIKLDIAFANIYLMESSVSGDVYFQDYDGGFYKLLTDSNSAHKVIDLQLPELCYDACVAVDSRDCPVVVGLCDRKKLYLGLSTISDSCTSFLIFKNYLVYTTSNNELKLFPLDYSHLYPDSDVSDIVKIFNDYSRNLERGAVLINKIESAAAVVLQMPRGNLETVYPRLLMLEVITSLMTSGDYLNAMLQARKHRIDLNYLVDFDYELFIHHLEAFVISLIDRDPDLLNLFISSVRNVDVIQTLYPNIVKAQDRTYVTTTKSNDICLLIRDYLIKTKDNPKIIQPLLTTYVRYQPTQLESALNALNQYSKKEHLNENIKYLIFLCDIDTLYNHCLSIYDLDLSLQVAQQSSMGPKEYIPFLNNLKAQSPEKKKYWIDQHLKRYDLALQHLFGSDEGFDLCLKHCELYSLHDIAFRIFKPHPQYKTFLQIYAKYLYDKSKYKECGKVSTMCDDYALAFDAYYAILDWENAVIALSKMTIDHEEKLMKIMRLINKLTDSKDFLPAAELTKSYFDDVEAVVALLIKGKSWKKALKTCYEASRDDLIETDVKINLIKSVDNIRSDLTEIDLQFKKQLERIFELRTSPINFGFIDAPCKDDGESDVSVISNQFTVYTQQSSTNSSFRSGRTCRSRKKQERSKNKGKKGSPFEMQYLLESMSRLITRVFDLNNEVASTLGALLELELVIQAADLQKEYNALVVRVNASLEEVFLFDYSGRLPFLNDQKPEVFVASLMPKPLVENQVAAYAFL